MKPTKFRVTFGTLFPGPGTEALAVKVEAQEDQPGGFGQSWSEQGDYDGPVSGA